MKTKNPLQTVKCALNTAYHEKIAIWDWYTEILQPVPAYKECGQMHISNDKLLITSTRIFYKNDSASLDCTSISELCSAINSTVATVHENFTSQH